MAEYRATVSKGPSEGGPFNVKVIQVNGPMPERAFGASNFSAPSNCRAFELGKPIKDCTAQSCFACEWQKNFFEFKDDHPTAKCTCVSAAGQGIGALSTTAIIEDDTWPKDTPEWMKHPNDGY